MEYTGLILICSGGIIFAIGVSVVLILNRIDGLEETLTNTRKEGTE